MQKPTPVYERVVLKLSGEAMQERGARDNISLSVVREIAERIKEVRDLGVQVAIVIGGGDNSRGRSASHRGMDRTTADYMGMLATVINALALRSTLDQMGVQTRVQTAIDMRNVAEPFILGRAIRHLELANGASEDERLGDISHIDGSLYTRFDAHLVKCAAQR